MTYLSSADLNAIRKDPSKVLASYAKYETEFVAAAGLGDAPEGVRVAAFCSVVAYNLKPYGASSALTLGQLLAADYLSCAQYVRLTMWLTEEFGRSDIVYNAVGWDYGNAVPNHSQLFVYSAGKSVLLDPTIGLIVRDANLPNVAYGVGYGPEKFISFYDANRAAGTDLSQFNAAVQTAISQGAYKHQYGIYDAPTPQEFETNLGSHRGMTIGNARSGSHLADKFIWSGKAWGGRGSDNILGLDSNDILDGGDGNDRLAGGAGKDVLAGGDGNDLLIGNFGRDILKGGDGADLFRFDEIKDSAKSTPDVIHDFQVGRDRISLKVLDANSDKVGNQAFSYIGSAHFSGHAGELRFASGIVHGDVNGDKVADFGIRVLGVNMLLAKDLIL